MADSIWPQGRRAGFALTFDVDAESAILAAGVHYASRLTTMSHQAYGPKVGVPRILRLLERHGVRSTFFVPGLTADRYPHVVEAIAAGGHEVAHHSYSHTELHRLDEGAERRELERGLASLERILGHRPVGYRAPMWELNERTPALLSEYGFRFDSSLMDDDRPYLLDTGGGRLAELPVHWMLDDWEQYAYVPEPHIGVNIENPGKTLDLWRSELEALADEGGLFIHTSHPFLSGRASRIRVLDRLLEHAKALGGVWIAPLFEIAEHVHQTTPPEQARPVPVVRIDDDVYGR
jgi:peptidoglycan/xylan/chitin deacetylase (PgdA/CDA1 family)